MDDGMLSKCCDAEQVIDDAYRKHVEEFRAFVGHVNEWFTNYQQMMCPKIMLCLSRIGVDDKAADWSILADLTSHAERFSRLTNLALSEYEEAYKSAKSVFNKAR